MKISTLKINNEQVILQLLIVLLFIRHLKNHSQ
jgi:hypothetical protein